jgi:predicted neuraminidase
MFYTFTVDRKAGYLHVRVGGDNSPETVLKYLGEVRSACERLECPYVLVEESLRGPRLGTLDIFSVVSEASKNVWPTVQRIAYVDVNAGEGPGLMKFAENVAVNRGVGVRVFPTVEEAVAWLLQEIAAARQRERLTT